MLYNDGSMYLILLVLVLSDLFLYRQTQKKIFKIVPYIIMAFFVGFRGNVGVDVQNYEKMYMYIKYGIHVKAEKGYYTIVRFCQYFGGTQQLVFLIVGILTIIFMYKYIDDNTDNFELSTIIYLCIGPYYFSSYNTIREALAVSIFLFALKYIKVRNKIYIIWLVIGSLFHTSILFFLGLPILVKRVKNYFYFICLSISVGSIVVKFKFFDFLIFHFLPQYRSYIIKYEIFKKYKFGLSYFIFLFISICLFCLIIKNKNILKVYKILLCLNIIFILTGLLAGRFTIVFIRIISYVSPILIILVPKIIDRFKNKKEIEIMIVIFCIGYYLLLTFNTPSIKDYVFNFVLID